MKILIEIIFKKNGLNILLYLLSKCNKEQCWTEQDTHIHQPIRRVGVESLYFTEWQVHKHS